MITFLHELRRLRLLIVAIEHMILMIMITIGIGGTIIAILIWSKQITTGTSSKNISSERGCVVVFGIG